MRPEEVIAKLGAHQQELPNRHRVASLALFGSTARRQARQSSDVDLVVVGEGEPDVEHFLDLKCRLEGLLGRRVDLVTRAGLRSGAKAAVEREAVRVT